MGRSSDIHRIRRAMAIPILATVFLLLIPAVALAVDGVPLYPPGIDAAYAWTSMENPDMSGPILTFEIFGLSDPTSPPVVKSSTAGVMFWNAAKGFNRNIGGEIPGLPDGADQRHSTVVDSGDDVYIAWQQRNHPIKATWDIWLWRGDENGTTAAGFPRLLVSGPLQSNQIAPELGITQTPSGSHLIVTWADDRGTAGATTEAYMLDLTADTDGDQMPDYLQVGYDPAVAGDSVDPVGDGPRDQRDPVVGAKGIFWLDLRDAQASGNADVYRADLAVGKPVISRFWANPSAYEAISPRATGDGAAWLGPGIAGGPFEPWVKVPGGEASILSFFANPTAFDVADSRFAVSAGHGGNTDGDGDIFLYDQLTGQSTPVCDVGGTTKLAYNKLKIQTMPSISSAPGGSRVVWSDSRQFTNTKTTPVQTLAYELYVALVPTVDLAVTRIVRNGRLKAHLRATVSPDFDGALVAFQRGKRNVATTPYGTSVWYSDWKTLEVKKLNNRSSATYDWTIPLTGTTYVRAWFKGGKRYTDVGKRRVPHVPMASAVASVALP